MIGNQRKKFKYHVSEVSHMKQIPLGNWNFLSIVVQAIVFIIILSVSLDYARIIHSECSSPYCTTFNHLPAQSYVAFGLLLVSMGVNVYLIVKPQNVQNFHPISKIQFNKLKGQLEDDEKKIFNEIIKNDGSAFQNDLIRSTGFSKVKVSRILDRLETKNLVERRRRGMSNIVVSKF